MTNEEKSRSLVEEYSSEYWGHLDSYDKSNRIAIEMAEWKDSQFREYLEKKKCEIEQDLLHSNPFIDSLIDLDRWRGRADIINEIINEFFKK